MAVPVPLRRSLFLQFFGVSVLPLLAVIVVVAAVTLKGLVADVERQTAGLGLAVRDQVEARLAARQTAVELLAFALADQTQPALRVRLMRELVRVDPVIDALYAAGSDGRVEQVALGPNMALQESDVLGLDVASRPFYQALGNSTRPVWSDTFLSTLTGRVTAVVAVPVERGALVAELSLQGLSRSLLELTTQTAALVVILDSQGRIIGHPDSAQAASQVSLRHIAMVREGTAGRDAHGSFDWDGVSYLGSVAHIGRTGWSVLVAERSTQVYAPLYQLGWAVLGGLALAMLGALAGAMVLSRTADRRYRQLIQAADSYVQAKVPPHIQFDILEFDQLWQNLRHLFEQIGARDAEARAARTQLQNVFDATTEVSIIATDAAGLITVFNSGAQKMLGYEAAALIGQQKALLLHDPAELARRGHELTLQLSRPVEGFDALVAVACQAGYEVRDWTYLRRDGTRLSVSVAVTAVRDGGQQPAGYLAVATDQSEHHRAAGLELARKVAEAASQNKSEFLSRVSHDLRTPLNAMLGFAQLLAMDTQSPLNQVQRDRVALIESAGWHLVRLIDDVLDLSRIESGNLQIKLGAVDLLPALDDAVRLVSQQATQQGVSISQQLPSDTGAQPLLAWADRTRLIQIVVNLLSNAVKYNVRGGQVSIEVDAAGSDQWRIEISDTGCGMNETQLARLFEPFNRLGMESSAIEGTGIGLVIVKRLVDLMDGGISVHSQVGVGTRVAVQLRSAVQPALKAAAGAEPALAAPEQPVQAVHDTLLDVVCIEDNPVNAMLMGQIFALRPACRLHVVSTADAGLAMIRRLMPSLVMLDLHLPDGSGLTLLERLRLEDTLRDTPVIVVSADGTQHSLSAAQRAGARAFLSKPIQIAGALHEIDAALTRP